MTAFYSFIPTEQTLYFQSAKNVLEFWDHKSLLNLDTKNAVLDGYVSHACVAALKLQKIVDHPELLDVSHQMLAWSGVAFGLLIAKDVPNH